MTLLQKWLSGLIGLGALYLVATDGKGIATALGAGANFISSTEKTAITGK